MKASHYITPRTLAECNFALNADPIDRPANTDDAWGRYGMGALVILFVVAIVLVWMTR